MNDNPGLAAREAASGLLSAVLEKHQPLDQAIVNSPAFKALSPQDRAFAQRMTKTTLRHLGQADALLQQWISKPLGPLLAPVQHALRLGIVQLFWLDLPPHAAVHLAVEMVKKHGFEHQVGLVNAVLNRAVREGRDKITLQDVVRLNTPEWLWESWVKAYGEPAARALAETHLEEPPLDISVKENPARWAEALGGELLAHGTVRLREYADIASLPGFAEGAWWVQDAAAAEPVKMLELAMGSLKGKQIADLCAAPGGKTAQLAAAGAHITAVDISANRMQTLHENLTRLQLQAEIVVSDVLKWQPEKPPDAILLDAPCSATGTLRRHPDVVYLRQPEDITRLCATQAKLLRHALGLLPTGGFLTYAVCSLQPEEGIGQIAALCAEHKNVKIHAQSLPVTPDGFRAGDGFYVAILKKTEAMPNKKPEAENEKYSGGILTLVQRLKKLHQHLEKKLEEEHDLSERARLEGFSNIVQTLFYVADATGPEVSRARVTLGRRIEPDSEYEHMLRDIIDTHPAHPLGRDMPLCAYLQEHEREFNDKQPVPLPKAIERFCAALREQLKTCDRPAR